MNIKINRHQRTALYAGLIIVVILGLFPPWMAVFKKGTSPVYSPLGYQSLFLRESLPADWNCDLDISSLLFSWLIAVMLTGGVVLWMRDRAQPEAEPITESEQAVEADPVVNLDLSGSLKRKRPRRARKLRKKKR